MTLDSNAKNKNRPSFKELRDRLSVLVIDDPYIANIAIQELQALLESPEVNVKVPPVPCEPIPSFDAFFAQTSEFNEVFSEDEEMPLNPKSDLLDIQDNEILVKLQKLFGRKVQLKELISLAKYLSKESGIHLNKWQYRSKKTLLAWLKTDWNVFEGIIPHDFLNKMS